MTTTHTREALAERDAADPLRSFREEFVLPAGVVYLDGNSLGPLPAAASARAADVAERQWGEDLIRSWNTNGWYEAPVRIGAKIAQVIGGSKTGACVTTDTTSINVFKAVSAALGVQREDAPGRRVIVSERANFPTDLYMVEGLIAWLDDDYELRLVDDEAGLDAALGDDVAVVMLTHVNYRSGRMWDMPAVTQRVHDAGALAVWDLCHSVGAVPLDLDGAGADFAVGCTYKYLNGGPGSPAFVWVADRHVSRAVQPLSGWFGHRSPFEMAVQFEPADDIRRFLCGTQPLLSMLTMEVGVDIALRADEAAVRRKSLELTTLFMELVDQRLAGHPLRLVTPRNEDERGSHVSYEHPDGYAVMQALISRGVIGDYREPSILRFGITPLYLGYADVWDAVEVLREVLDDELWRAPDLVQRGAVT